MKLSIIILNYNSVDWTDKCLTTIAKHKPKVSYEIVVVDNASKKDELKEIEKKWQKGEHKNIVFIQSPSNLGYGQGNELGVKNSEGEYIAILNPDIEVKEDSLDGLLDFMEKNPKVGLVGPKLIYPDTTVQDSFRRFPSPLDITIKRIPWLRAKCPKRMANFLMWDIDFTKPSEVDWVVGAFFVARRKAWLEIGGFDKRYFLFFEDTDICRMMWEKGWKVYYNPLFSAIHNHERLSDTTSAWDYLKKKTVRIHIKSAFKYFWKWGLSRERG